MLDEILIICESTVLSQVIETLKKDPALAEWVKNGLDLHFNKNSTDTCQFCNQKIPEDRLSDLHNHFNDQYNFFINKAQVKIQQLISINSNLAISFPDKDKFYEHFLTEYEEKIVVATGIIKKYFDFISSLIKALEEKKLKPFESTSFSVHAQLTALPSRDIFDKKISEINLLIDNHNLETCNFENEIAKTAASLEDHFIASALDEYKSKVEYINQAKADEVHIKTEIEQLNISIKEIKKEISEHLIPAEQLNKELTSYLGHSELVFEVKNNSYVISRNGYLAKNLSEGEKTAIAFLYFLKSLQDKSFDIEKSIVVIDDPISSLDTNAIYCAFCFMKERTKNAGQLFILTHNASFFRQTKNWFQHERAKKKSNPTQRPAHFFMLISHIELDGKRAAEITTLDDLLYKYESDYHYMFKLIYEAAKCSQRNIPLESYYGLPNVARRLIESFLAFRYPANIWGLEKKIEIVDFDRPKKLRILRFLHTFSHNDRIHDGEHDLSILRETPDVLKDMLELIRCEDEHHFKEMEIAIASQIGVI